MAACGACNATIVFGGKEYQGMRFCNEKCLDDGRVALAARYVSAQDAHGFATSIHQGRCPKCSGAGPVDIRTSHSVWSAFVTTQWKSTQYIACRRCGRKEQAMAALSSAVVGWWGIPQGLVMTPVQIARNIAGMAERDSSVPSSELVKQARLILAERALARGEIVSNKPTPQFEVA